MDVILTNENDEEIGTMEKMAAHEKGVLHRAFSIFIFNEKREMLLQRRASEKYHSGGLWTNTCCSHPAPGEDIFSAAVKRLKEEMGFQCVITKAFEFTYRAPVGNGLTEFEYDHVFTGKYSGDVNPDASEVSDYCFRSISGIRNELISAPQNYTAWFLTAFPLMEKYLSSSDADHLFS